MWPVVAVALGVVVLHMATNGRYGFNRDELQFLSDARHLDWGFVPYPPMTAFLEHVLLGVFGPSLTGLRVFSVLAQAAAIVGTGWMARELGGGGRARLAAAMAVALSALPLSAGAMFQYTSFDYLWWVVTACFVVRLLKTENARWWMGIGGAIGLGLETKYSILFLVAGIVVGMALTSARRYFRSAWFWGGAGLALVLFLPNLIWLARHDFVTYRFLQEIHERDVRLGYTRGFLKDQVLVCLNVFAVPLAIAGLVSCFRQRRYRMLGWMYGTPLVLFVIGQGRGYYLAAGYPMLLAMGAVAAERWMYGVPASGGEGSARLAAPEAKKARRKAAKGVGEGLPAAGRLTIQAVFYGGLLLWGAWVAAVVIPLAQSGWLRNFTLVRNEELRDEFGWEEQVKTVAAIRDGLTAEERAKLGVFAGNYGEEGAMEMFGQAYGLPAPIGLMNSAWLRGYPTPAPETLIVLGLSREQAERTFTGCRLAGRNGNAEGIRNEESVQHPEIFVCGGPREPWADFWRDFQTFG
jgi:4-amino-4-deoxy-L-arabinose transferase-like glycosyltransferase